MSWASRRQVRHQARLHGRAYDVLASFRRQLGIGCCRPALWPGMGGSGEGSVNHGGIAPQLCRGGGRRPGEGALRPARMAPQSSGAYAGTSALTSRPCAYELGRHRDCGDRRDEENLKRPVDGKRGESRAWLAGASPERRKLSARQEKFSPTKTSASCTPSSIYFTKAEGAAYWLSVSSGIAGSVLAFVSETLGRTRQALWKVGR